MGRPRRVMSTLSPACATCPMSAESLAFAFATVVVFMAHDQMVKMTTLDLPAEADV